MTDKGQVQCSECGRVYTLSNLDGIRLGGRCPADDCPANNECPKSGTLTIETTDD